jgi:hypothetical protein
MTTASTAASSEHHGAEGCSRFKLEVFVVFELAKLAIGVWAIHHPIVARRPYVHYGAVMS